MIINFLINLILILVLFLYDRFQRPSKQNSACNICQRKQVCGFLKTLLLKVGGCSCKKWLPLYHFGQPTYYGLKMLSLVQMLR